MEAPVISKADMQAYERDGAIVARGVFKDWIETMAEGAIRNSLAAELAATAIQSETAEFFHVHEWTPVPDPDADPSQTQVLEWALKPDDTIFFGYRTARGARHVERLGHTSPPYPGHQMQNGQKLREDWFPVIWRKSE